MGSNWADWDEERSVVSDASDIHLDFEEEKSLLSFAPYDSGPVVVSQPFPFSRGLPQSAVVGETSADSVTIQNLTDEPVQLWSIRIISSIPKDSYTLSLMKPPSRDSDEESVRNFCGSTFLEDRMLQPHQTLTVWLSCKPVSIGMYNAVVHFDVGDEKIERLAFILAEDEISRSLASGNPYNRGPRKKGFTVDRYVHGTRPARTNVREFRFRLPPFNIPSDVRDMIESNRVPDVIAEGLSIRTYARYFSILLVMEELHLEEEMKTYDMEYVTMRKRGNLFLSLEVPGLAEKRPSLVCGDFIFTKLSSEVADIRSEPYQGYIHRVEAEEIYLKFAPEFHQRHLDDNHYNVRFTYNRINMRRMYQAVHEAETLGPDVLFPSESRTGRQIRNSHFKPFYQDLNEEQLFAVGKILGCRGLPPYVIHGPPGTGKTLTLVESILQLYRDRRKNAKILVCAASNSAADHILEKLICEDAGIQESKIFRLNASSRQYEDVKPEFIGFCFCDDMVFKCPPRGALLRYKIIISTYMSTSLLYAEGIRRGHFTHIILDEAGQASEPEMMIPLANLCCRDTVVVLAGDPMQLGPVVYSKSAESHGLGRSYLDRLFECESYQHGDENYVTKLIRNYRCHPAILDLPSRLFYNGELIASKVEDDSMIYDLLDLPNKAFPVLFVGIQGCDEREGNNPSWFNRTEASKVVEFIRKIKRNTDLSEPDIGIITPYRQQVLKLKKALDNLEMPDVKVGSVEQFQGQERKVIIVSTVRSTVMHNEFDRVHNLGFLSNPRRFNVAITRAKSLLIIIGNPNIIAKDSNWYKLLRHCADNNSYEGCPLPPLEMHDQASYGTKDGNLGGYCNDVEWDEYLPEQHPDRTEWSDNPLYSNGVIWGEDNESEQHTVKTGWHDETHLYSDDVTWGEDIEQHKAEGHGGNGDHAQYCDDNEWQEDTNRYAGENDREDQQPRVDSNNVPWDGGSGLPRKGQGWTGGSGEDNSHSSEIAQADDYYKPKLYNNDVEWE